jgi:hypothetical protein
LACPASPYAPQSHPSFWASCPRSGQVAFSSCAQPAANF